MKSSELRGFIRKGDIIVILSVIVLSAAWFMMSLFSYGGELQVKIYSDGQVKETVYLTSLEEEKIISLDGCRIKVTKEGVCFLSSDCPDGLCVKRGMMKRADDVMACVPNGVTVEIRGSDSKIDGISY